MSDNFYAKFENSFHAPVEVVRQLRKQYLPYVLPLAKEAKVRKAVDLGCGRGEWLSLMQGIGLEPYGVDLDEGMLSIARAEKLPCHFEDAITHIKGLKTESQIIVSAFHVIEHINFDQIRTLFTEALRVLTPGGLLILETPNLENPFVATQNFYLDHTHLRPVPILQLAFLSNFSGFGRHKIIRLQEGDKDLLSHRVSLYDVYYGASRDCAIISQKSGNEMLWNALDNAYSNELGISIDAILKKWDEDYQYLHNNISTRSEEHSQRLIILEENSKKLAALEENSKKLINLDEHSQRLAMLEKDSEKLTSLEEYSQRLIAVEARFDELNLSAPVRFYKYLSDIAKKILKILK